MSFEERSFSNLFFLLFFVNGKENLYDHHPVIGELVFKGEDRLIGICQLGLLYLFVKRSVSTRLYQLVS